MVIIDTLKKMVSKWFGFFTFSRPIGRSNAIQPQITSKEGFQKRMEYKKKEDLELKEKFGRTMKKRRVELKPNKPNNLNNPNNLEKLKNLKKDRDNINKELKTLVKQQKKAVIQELSLNNKTFSLKNESEDNYVHNAYTIFLYKMVGSPEEKESLNKGVHKEYINKIGYNRLGEIGKKVCGLKLIQDKIDKIERLGVKSKDLKGINSIETAVDQGTPLKKQEKGSTLETAVDQGTSLNNQEEGSTFETAVDQGTSLNNQEEDSTLETAVDQGASLKKQEKYSNLDIEVEKTPVGEVIPFDTLNKIAQSGSNKSSNTTRPTNTCKQKKSDSVRNEKGVTSARSSGSGDGFPLETSGPITNPLDAKEKVNRGSLPTHPGKVKSMVKNIETKIRNNQPKLPSLG